MEQACKKVRKYKLKAKPSFDSLFLRLLSYNVLTLPNQIYLRNKLRKVVGVDEEGNPIEKKIHVTDGEGFIIEIKIGDKFQFLSI